jgi:Putative peptidoglycan binding domain
MRIFVVLICSLALASVAHSAQQEENKQQKKKQPQTVQHAPPPRTGRPPGAGAGPKKAPMGAYQGKGQSSMRAYQGQKGKKGQISTGAYQAPQPPDGPKPAAPRKKGQISTGAYQGQKGRKGQTSTGAYEGQKGRKGQTSMGAYEGQTGKAKGGKVTGAATGKPFKPQKFNLPTRTTPTKVAAVNFQQGRRIEGSQNWQGSNYQVFRNYKSEWHDQGWWRNNYNNRVVFVYGGWYAWNAGYWIPAWGYAPNAYYAYDGPIYGYNNLPPDQVIANVQSALQQQGYYQGEVDGLLGPQTRAAIADYQRATGLPETASVDQPTLESLGMS